ncbi:MAG: relaxase/mobilization nuclease domain-containing protein, partial [Clostridiales bacterium]|nr:relaxase/mobilization nuclease domain-containing protein [Clostridiales bacterium]
MAYIKMVDIKDSSKTHFKNALEYILRNEKTQNGILIDSYYCTPEFAEIQFEQVRSREVVKKGNNIAWHLYQSFPPDDNVTPEQALEIGKELMKRFYPNYQYVIATHTDKNHIHSHILINSVDFKTFHKLNFNKNVLAQIQAVSDDICLENNLSVIDTDGTLNQRRNLRKSAFMKIDEFFKAIKKEYPQELLPAEELSLSDEEIKNYNKIILDSLENIKDSINTSLEDYIENNSTEIS